MNGIKKLAIIPIEHTILKIIIVIESKAPCQKKSDRQVKFEIKMLSLIFEKVLEYFLHEENLIKYMCLIVLGWDIHPKYQLILAANRDEFYARPTQKAHKWSKEEFFAGKDLQAGGTWLGVNNQKIAAITNYRDPKNIKENAPSRGEIPISFLKGSSFGNEYMRHLKDIASDYNGFNFLTFDQTGLLHLNNQEKVINRLSPGIHALSNATIDSPWPKAIKAKEKLKRLLSMDFDHQMLIEMMNDTEMAEDKNLPQTGVPQEWEKALSAMCIRTENYGTCCTSVITIDRAGNCSFTEKTYPVGHRDAGIVNFNFQFNSL